MQMEQSDSSETSANKIHTPGNHPIESIQTRRTRLNFEVKNKCSLFGKTAGRASVKIIF